MDLFLNEVEKQKTKLKNKNGVGTSTINLRPGLGGLGFHAYCLKQQVTTSLPGLLAAEATPTTGLYPVRPR